LLEPAAESPLDTPSTGRLVIRIKLIPQQQPPARRRLSKSAWLVLIGAVAVLLGWFGVRTFKSEPTPPPPAISTAPAPAPKPVELPVQVPADAPTSPLNEHLPDVPQSALDTIRGTVRVAVRVTIDNQGTVTDAIAADRGPSRYFERLALNSSKQWTFTPTRSDAPRIMLVRFNFTRTGVTAEASPEQ
jgi:TonB family protein